MKKALVCSFVVLCGIATVANAAPLSPVDSERVLAQGEVVGQFGDKFAFIVRYKKRIYFCEARPLGSEAEKRAEVKCWNTDG